VDGIQVQKVEAVSQSKSHIVWIYNTVCTGYTWSPLTGTDPKEI
jgi:Ni,Fe-hydrogenase I small subunit